MAVESDSLPFSSGDKSAVAGRWQTEQAAAALPYDTAQQLAKERPALADYDLAETLRREKHLDRLANQPALPVQPSNYAAAVDDDASADYEDDEEGIDEDEDDEEAEVDSEASDEDELADADDEFMGDSEPSEASDADDDLSLADEDEVDEEGYDYYAERGQRRLSQPAVSAAAAPARLGTDTLLQQSWFNLIDSFGLTLIWINIHAFLHRVFGDEFFGPLGSEWVPKAGRNSRQTVRAFTSTVGIFEAGAVFALDLLALFLILAVLTLIAIIVYALVQPVDFFMELFNLAWN
jgi:hypothetical protein